MKHIFSLARVFFIVTILLTPVGTPAQTPFPRVKTLQVSFWPEYDRLDVLMIYRLQLSADTKLPAQVRLRLPAYLEGVHALAIEREGRLLNVNPKTVEWSRDEGGAWLSFPVSSPNIHLEYYDPVILNKEGQTRRIRYTFAAPADIETAIFELQHPVHAEEVSLETMREHEPLTIHTGRSSLQYSTIKVMGIAGDESFEVIAGYQRNSGELSSQPQPVQAAPSVQTEDSATIDEPTEKVNPSSQILFLFLGAALASLIWWLRDIGRRSSSASSSPEGEE